MVPSLLWGFCNLYVYDKNIYLKNQPFCYNYHASVLIKYENAALTYWRVCTHGDIISNDQIGNIKFHFQQRHTYNLREISVVLNKKSLSYCECQNKYFLDIFLLC